MANIKDILNKVQFCIEEDTEAIAGILVTMVGFPHTLWPNTLADVEALGDKLIERGGPAEGAGQGASGSDSSLQWYWNGELCL